jgi:hypothetical protein
MTNRLRFLTVVLVLTTACFAQEGFTVQRNGKQKCPGAEAQKIYLSTCAIVQRDFGATHSVAPTITMVLGSYSNEVRFDKQEIRLTKWDRNAFAQGVVMLAFEDVMLVRRVAMAKRAVIWVDTTVDVERLTK